MSSSTTQPDPHATPTATGDTAPTKSEFALGTDDPSATGLALVGVFGTLIVYLAIVGMAGFFLMFEEWETERKVYSQTWTEVKEYKTGVYERLGTPTEHAAYDAMRSSPTGEAAEVSAEPDAPIYTGRESGPVTGDNTRLGDAMRAVQREYGDADE